jgi:hypothetical protein
MFQMGNFGPMPGQVHHFAAVENEEDRRYGLARYSKETRRLYAVMDGRLATRDYFADELSIADFAILGWAWRHPRHNVDLADYPNVRRWYEAMMARPGVTRGFEVNACANAPRVPASTVFVMRAHDAEVAAPSGSITAISPSARYGVPATARNGLPWLEMARLLPRRPASTRASAARVALSAASLAGPPRTALDTVGVAEHELAALARAAIRARQDRPHRNAQLA